MKEQIKNIVNLAEFVSKGIEKFYVGVIITTPIVKKGYLDIRITRTFKFEEHAKSLDEAKDLVVERIRKQRENQVLPWIMNLYEGKFRGYKDINPELTCRGVRGLDFDFEKSGSLKIMDLELFGTPEIEVDIVDEKKLLGDEYLGMICTNITEFILQKGYEEDGKSGRNPVFEEIDGGQQKLFTQQFTNKQLQELKATIRVR